MANLNALFATLSVATLLGFASTMAEAGPYGDDLGKCFVNSTTPTDKRASAANKKLQATGATSSQIRGRINHRVELSDPGPGGRA